MWSAVVPVRLYLRAEQRDVPRPSRGEGGKNRIRRKTVPPVQDVAAPFGAIGGAAMMVCAGCGAELPDDAAFCPKCGSPNPDHARSAPPAVGQEHVGAPARNRTRIIAAVAGLGILLAGAGIAWFLLHGRTAQGALVSLTSREPIAGAGIQYASGVAKTDTAGRFVLPKLRLGTHDVTVTVPGFAPFVAACGSAPPVRRRARSRCPTPR